MSYSRRMYFTHNRLPLQMTLFGLIRRQIEGQTFIAMSDTTGLIWMKDGRLVQAVVWHLTVLILPGLIETLQNIKRPHFLFWKAISSTAAAVCVMKC